MDRSSQAMPEMPACPGLVVPGDRSPEAVEFECAMVDFFVDAAELLGVPKSVAVIYGVVFASPPPLSFGEIQARLNISKGSISQGLRVLREVGALKEVSAVDDRVERFTPDLELRKLVWRFLEHRLQKQFDGGTTRLAALTRAVPKGQASEMEILRSRLKSLRDWHRKARALLPIAKTLLKLGS